MNRPILITIDDRMSDERARIEAERELIWAEMEPLMRADAALVKQLIELNEKEAVNGYATQNR